MSLILSNKAKAIKTSPTLAVFSKARKMIDNGIDTINFSVGEPDFNTPDYVKKAAYDAIKNNFTRYTVAAGIPELKEAIIKKMKNDNNLDYCYENIIVTPGAKAAIATILTAICNPGDQVIIPTPYWVSYPSQVELADGFPVILETEAKDDFKIDPKQLDKLLSSLPNGKALILNSPSNPSGMVYKKDELKAIAEVCVKHNIIIISDEIYEKLIYGNTKHWPIADISEETKKLTVIINGISKAYAMTGWRLGYAVGPEEIISKAVKIQSHTASCINSITQKATVAALTIDDGSLEKMRQEFEKRKIYITKALNDIEHINCIEPQGAFYCLPDVSYYIKNNTIGITDDVQLCTWFLEKHKIAIVPGSAFGINNFIRFSYANSLENLQEGIRRFQNGCNELI